MRTFSFALLAGLLCAAPASAATRNFGITSFSKIRIVGPYKVRLATGVAPFAKASGTSAAIDRIALDVEGDTLIIRSDPSWGGGYPGEDPGPVELDLGTHDLSSATVLGAGSLSIDKVKGLSFILSMQGSGVGEIGEVATDQFNVTLIGTAAAKIKGHALKLTALVRGVSSLDAQGLTAPNAQVSADGTATVAATVTDTARVDAWGPATIRFAGRPSCTLKLQGSTSVSGCR